MDTWTVNQRMTELLLEHLDPSTWRARPPGPRTRTIAAIFAHIHNVRRKWIRLSAPDLPLPAALDPARCTQDEARAALAESADRCFDMILSVDVFRRDGWARPLPAGPAMIAYMIAHDAHHRGQVCMLARQLGFPLPAKLTSRMWAWESLTSSTHPARPDPSPSARASSRSSTNPAAPRRSPTCASDAPSSSPPARGKSGARS